MDWSYFYGENAPYLIPYSLPHLLYLAFSALVIFLMIRCRGWVRRHKNGLCLVLAAFVMFQQVSLYTWYALVTDFDLTEALPLHICRLCCLLILVFAFTKSRFALDTVCYFSVFALSSFFYPMRIYHLSHVLGIQFMIAHLSVVLMPFFAVIAYDWRPCWKSCFRAAVAFTVYLAVILFVNPLLGSNYFYLIDRPFLNGLPLWLFAGMAYVVTVGAFAAVTAVCASGKPKACKQTLSA